MIVVTIESKELFGRADISDMNSTQIAKKFIGFHIKIDHIKVNYIKIKKNILLPD